VEEAPKRKPPRRAGIAAGAASWTSVEEGRIVKVFNEF
jgi:hypothetical protein